MKTLEVEPDFNNISDIELIGLVSYCEKWKPSKVYNIAYGQVFGKKQLKEVKKDFTDWYVTDGKLPIVVRVELLRAAQINLEQGKMNKLKYAHLSMTFFSNKLFWIFMMIVLWWWL